MNRLTFRDWLWLAVVFVLWIGWDQDSRRMTKLARLIEDNGTKSDRFSQHFNLKLIELEADLNSVKRKLAVDRR